MAAPDLITPQIAYEALLQSVKNAGGQRAWAKRFGVHEGLLSETINKKRDLTPAITAALGLIEVRRYVPVRAKAWPA